MEIVVVLLLLAVLAEIQAILIRVRGLKNISFQRFFEKKSAFCGEEITYTEVLKNKKLMFLPWVRIESRISPFLQFSKEKELDIEGQRYHKSVFSLLPYTQVTRTYHVRLNRRGYYHLDTVSVTAGDLFGLAQGANVIKTDASVCVYPRLADFSDDLSSSHWQGDVVVKRWIAPDLFLINGIREYHSGDQMRDIAWAATARMGTLQVKTYDCTANPRLFVLLNCQKAESQWGQLMDYEHEFVETGISQMATMCVKALEIGMAVGFGTNMPTDNGDSPTLCLPQYHSGQAAFLLEAMAHLTVKRAVSFTTFLAETQIPNDCDVVILSAYESEEINTQINRLRLCGNGVSFRRIQGEIPS